LIIGRSFIRLDQSIGPYFFGAIDLVGIIGSVQGGWDWLMALDWLISLSWRALGG
jgi:hypothetical protein